MGASKLLRLQLRQRAYSVVLSIYYCEFIKSTALSTLKSAYPGGRDGKQINESFADALRYLVSDGLLDPSERDELLQLVRFRNNIAHRIHHVITGTAVITTGADAAALVPLHYDDGALDRLRYYADEIVVRLELRYPVAFALAPFVFEVARNEYERELKNLDRQIESAMRSTQSGGPA